MPEGITVRGVSEVQRNLADFPRLLVMECFSKALSRAAGVFEEELRAVTPETDYSTSSEEFGHLVDNLVSTVTIDSQGRGGRARISFGKKGFVALWVDFGHRMLSHSGKEIKAVPGTGFMRRAFESAAERALEVFVETVKEFMSGSALSKAA